MPRLYVAPELIGNETLVIAGEEHRHVCRVLRLGEGDLVTLFDGRGNEADARIGRAGPRAVEVRIVARRQAACAQTSPITLLAGIAKGDKMELVVQKSTELGVSHIVPVVTDRAVVRLDEVRSSLRRVRWQKIAREASRQCGRADVPDVAPVVAFDAALAAVKSDALKLFFWEEPPRKGLREALSQLEAAPPAVVIAVGPEGGFTYREVDLARERGFLIVGLGPRILRTETASLAALAMVGYAIGDLG
jgi:16S rRNA (uracil1498-N3)-methyltransferase